MGAIVEFFRRLAHDCPGNAALCATALLEEEVVEIAQTVGRALVQHYGVAPGVGGLNYTAHEAIERRSRRDQEDHPQAPAHPRRSTRRERAMREMPAAPRVRRRAGAPAPPRLAAPA